MPSSEAYKRSLAQRVRMNRAILEKAYWVLPVDDKGHERFTPVGRGVRTSELCGKHLSFVVCKNIEEHKGVSVGGVDCSGKVVVRHKHMWCHKSTCPVCFIRGWSVRGAQKIAGRLEKGVERGFGKIEHISVSVPPEEYHLSEKALRKKARSALKIRGVVGGCMIFHGFRIDRKRGVLVWSPHYHTLGFIKGGFDRCRECVHVREDCASCDGFKGKEVRGFAKDGILVKVMAEREKSYVDGKPNVFGSAFYSLNHATIKVSAFSRFHAVTWVGICGNRKYATPKVEVEVTCPACGDVMKRSVYVGFLPFVKDVGSPDYEAISLRPKFGLDGSPNFIDKG
jgi:hypothetical protein